MSNFDHIYLASVSDGIWERTKLNLASNRTARNGVITNDRDKASHRLRTLLLSLVRHGCRSSLKRGGMYKFSMEL